VTRLSPARRGFQRHAIEGDLGFAGAGHVGELDGVVTEMKLGKFVHAVPVQAPFEHVGEQHGVVERRDLDPVAGEHLHVVLDVLADLENRSVREQRFEQGDRALERNLLRRVALGRAASAAGIAKIERPLRRRADVAERDITRAPARESQRDADQIGAERIERGGFGIDRDSAFGMGFRDPARENLFVLDQFI
jgi:hypothetical protein